MDAAYGDTVVGTVFHTDGKDKDKGRHKDIARA